MHGNCFQDYPLPTYHSIVTWMEELSRLQLKSQLTMFTVKVIGDADPTKEVFYLPPGVTKRDCFDRYPSYLVTRWRVANLT